MPPCASVMDKSLGARSFASPGAAATEGMGWTRASPTCPTLWSMLALLVITGLGAAALARWLWGRLTKSLAAAKPSARARVRKSIASYLAAFDTSNPQTPFLQLPLEHAFSALQRTRVGPAQRRWPGQILYYSLTNVPNLPRSLSSIILPCLLSAPLARHAIVGFSKCNIVIPQVFLFRAVEDASDVHRGDGMKFYTSPNP